MYWWWNHHLLSFGAFGNTFNFKRKVGSVSLNLENKREGGIKISFFFFPKNWKFTNWRDFSFLLGKIYNWKIIFCFCKMSEISKSKIFLHQKSKFLVRWVLGICELIKYFQFDIWNQLKKMIREFLANFKSSSNTRNISLNATDTRLQISSLLFFHLLKPKYFT